ncbi:MAG TPA: Holliday junction resolvase RuvX, partial [Candidatus Limnocylindrales bacterium]
MTRPMGIDLGERRIGVAIVDAEGGRARPLATLARGRSVERDAARLRPLVARHATTELVVGLPLEARGGEGPQAAMSRGWAEAIGPLIGLPVTLRDERLTSHLAEERLGPMKRGRSGGPPTQAQRRAHRERVDRE